MYSKYEGQDNWYAVTVVVRTKQLLQSIGHLREVGGSGITVVPARYIFQTDCGAFNKLIDELKPARPVEASVAPGRRRR